MMTYGEPCIIEDRLCTECGECDYCEINADKICDNCCQCLSSEADFRGIDIDEILINTEDAKPKVHPGKGFQIKSK